MNRRFSQTLQPAGDAARYVLLTGVLAIVATLPSARAAGVTIASIEVGFDGYYVIGSWTPVVVSLTGGSETVTGFVELTLADGDGALCTFTSNRPVQLVPGRTERVWCYAQFGNPDSVVNVDFVVDGQAIAQRRFIAGDDPDLPFRVGLPTRRPLFLTLGPSVGLTAALGGDQENFLGRAKVVRLTSSAGLPTRWYGYDGIEAIFVATSQPEQLRELTADSIQFRALETWVRHGGRIVISAGENAALVLSDDSGWSRFGLGTYEKMVRVPFLRNLESYGETNSPFPRTEDGWSVPQIADVTGVVEVREANVPLVVRRAHGFGEVVFVALDVDRAPVADWSARPQFTRRLLGFATKPASDAADIGHLDRSGITDLAGQLRYALDQFEDVRPVSFSLVALLVVAYLALIGPLDYFLVRRVIRRNQATWVTLPVWILLASVGAFVLARSFKGDSLRVNQVEVVDVDMATGANRGFTWTNIFSPAMRRYDVALDVSPTGDRPAQPEVVTSWFGMPGGGFGGMNTLATTATTTANDAYQAKPDLTGCSNVAIPVWASKAFAVRWNAQTTPIDGCSLEARADGLLRGQVVNPLDGPLEDPMLVFGPWAYPLETMADNTPVFINPQSDRLQLTTKITRKRMVYDREAQEYVQSGQRYDRLSGDVDEIVSQMLFYNNAGSAAHTRLLNSYQSEVDMSHLVRAGKAVLVGRSPQPQSRMTVDGKEPHADHVRRTTFYRFVIPVVADSVAPDSVAD